MKSRVADAVYALAILGGCGLLFLETQSDYYDETGIGFSSSPVFYPKILLAMMAALALVLLVQGLWQSRAEPATAAAPFWRMARPLLVVLVLTVLFGALFPVLPFLVTGIAYCLLLGFLLGYRRYVYLIPTGVLVPVVVSLVFEHLLSIPLP